VSGDATSPLSAVRDTRWLQATTEEYETALEEKAWNEEMVSSTRSR
jgi:hypothetical protein